MSNDSLELISEFQDVAQKVGISLEPKENEFEQKYLKAFAQKIYDNMDVKFDLEDLGTVYVFPEEYFEYLELIKESPSCKIASNFLGQAGVVWSQEKNDTEMKKLGELLNIQEDDLGTRESIEKINELKKIYRKFMGRILVSKFGENNVPFNLKPEDLTREHIKKLLENEDTKEDASKLFAYKAEKTSEKVLAKFGETEIYFEQGLPRGSPGFVEFDHYGLKEDIVLRKIKEFFVGQLGGYAEILASELKKSLNFREFRPSNIRSQVISENEIPDFLVPFDIKNKKLSLEESVIKKIIRRSIVDIATIKELFDAVEKELSTAKFDIFIMLSLLRRVFPEKKKKFLDNQVVSGFKVENDVVTFRKEALLKTLLHEIHHNLGHEDVVKTGWSKNLYAFDHSMKRDNPLGLQEDVVDPPANLANIIMTAYESGARDEEFWEDIAQMWEVEKLFAIYQTAKMLYLHGFENFEQFLSPKEGGPVILQELDMADYPIVKAAIINNMNDYLEVFMKPENEGEVSEKLEGCIKKSLNDQEFKDKVNKLIKAFGQGDIINEKQWTVPQSFYDEGEVPEVIPEDLIFGGETPAFLFDTGRMDVIEPEI